MANLLNQDEKQKYIDAYKRRKKSIIENLFLHEYTSPYDEIENRNIIRDTDVSTDEILQKIESDDFIDKIRSVEIIKMANMYSQLVTFLDYNQEIDSDNLLLISKKFMSYNFKEQIRLLNLAYNSFLHNDKIGSQLLDNNGRIRWEQIQSSLGGYFVAGKDKNGKQTQIRELGEQEEEWFNEWYKIFNPVNSSGNISKADTSKGLIKTKIQLSVSNPEKLLQEFNLFEEKLQQEIEDNKEKDYMKSEMLSIIQKYTLGRGLNFISQLFESSSNKQDSFLQAQTELSKKTSNVTLQSKILGSSKPKNIHYEYYKIKGSFKHTIGAGNYRGFIAEDLVESAFGKLNFKLKEGSRGFSWQSIREGTEVDIRGKMQKIDNVFVIPELIKYKRNGKDITINTKTKNNIKIGLSLKDYRDDDVSIHSAGNLDSVSSYLQQNIDNAPDTELAKITNNYLKKINSNIVKYALINEGEPNRIKSSRDGGFFKMFSQNLSNLGPVFALSRISEKNNLDASEVDFLVINQTIIPGSLLFQAIKEVVKYSVTISPATYPAGDYTPTIEKTNKLYSKQMLEHNRSRNEKIYNQTTFSFHLKKKFKNYLMELIR